MTTFCSGVYIVNMSMTYSKCYRIIYILYCWTCIESFGGKNSQFETRLSVHLPLNTLIGKLKKYVQYTKASNQWVLYSVQTVPALFILAYLWVNASQTPSSTPVMHVFDDPTHRRSYCSKWSWLKWSHFFTQKIHYNPCLTHSWFLSPTIVRWFSNC